MRHLTTLCDLKAEEIERVFAITEDLKVKCDQGLRESLLPGRTMAMLFEKPSLRTRVSFEAAMCHLGGSSLLLGDEAGFGQRESLDDFGRVLSQYVDVIVVRAHQHETVLSMALNAVCTVINGLTDEEHPCQALADMYTLREVLGTLKGHKLVYVGDGNNVARSLAIGCGKMGMSFALATPKGYEFDAQFLAKLPREVPDLEMDISSDPKRVMADASAIYTDVWTSMGQEKQRATRRQVFAPYQVNQQLMAQASPKAWFMHCLPAHRGEEVTDEVIDGDRSIVVQQAANRLHVQKGILAWLLGAQT